MKLEEIRKEIDKVDSQIAKLFIERMDLALEVAKTKEENNLAVVNNTREKEILHRISGEIGEPLDSYGRILFNTLFDLSRSYQNNYLSLLLPIIRSGQAHLHLRRKYSDDCSQLCCFPARQ